MSRILLRVQRWMLLTGIASHRQTRARTTRPWRSFSANLSAPEDRSALSQTETLLRSPSGKTFCKITLTDFWNAARQRVQPTLLTPPRQRPPAHSGLRRVSLACEHCCSSWSSGGGWLCPRAATFRPTACGMSLIWPVRLRQFQTRHRSRESRYRLQSGWAASNPRTCANSAGPMDRPCMTRLCSTLCTSR